MYLLIISFSPHCLPFSWQKPEGVEGIDWKRYGKNQWYYIDEKGRPYPCCEYDYDEKGFDIDV
jgi:hypothetical protein